MISLIIQHSASTAEPYYFQLGYFKFFVYPNSAKLFLRHTIIGFFIYECYFEALPSRLKLEIVAYNFILAVSTRNLPNKISLIVNH